MGGNVELLEQKIEQVLSLVERLKTENAKLQQENNNLRLEMTTVNRLNRRLKVSFSDQSDVIKTKLHSVLSRIEDLEDLKA